MALREGLSILCTGLVLIEFAWTVPVPAGIFQKPNVTILDMTYSFDNWTLYYPDMVTPPLFNKTTIEDIGDEKGHIYRMFHYAAPDHGGTHMDSPYHFAKDGIDSASIPLEELMGPAAVIDVSKKVESNHDYRVSVEDINDWESKFGRIPDGAFVFMFANWPAGRWPDRNKVFGTANYWDPSTYHFPSFHPNTTKFLVDERNIKGLGVDSSSTDYGQTGQDFGTHKYLADRNLTGFEFVANLDKMPLSGGHVLIFPTKITHGGGSPARIIGIF